MPSAMNTGVKSWKEEALAVWYSFRMCIGSLICPVEGGVKEE